MRRNVTIELDQETSRFLNQEKSRIYTSYGIKVSLKDIISTLIKQHSLRVVSEADEQEAILWYYDYLKEQNESRETTRATKATRSTESRKRSRTKAKS